jgi:starch phosphorylase
MNKQTRATHPIYNLLPTEIEGFDSLAELALDMHWSWVSATQTPS